MPKTTISNDLTSFAAKWNTEVDTGNPDLQELFRRVHVFGRAVPLYSLSLKQYQGPNSGLYTYEFEATDGRKWSQRINPSFGTMNFDVTDYWKVSEFETHRAVRDKIIFCVQRLELYDLDVTWQ